MNFLILNKLEGVKNNILTVVGIIYGIGYLSWAIYSFSESLGVIPAFDSQYFVGGIPPSLIICYSYLFIKFGIDKINSIRLRLSGHPTGKWHTLRTIYYFSISSALLIMFLIMFYYIIIEFLTKKSNTTNSNEIIAIFYVIICIVFCILFIFIPYDFPKLFVIKNKYLRLDYSKRKIFVKKILLMQAATIKFHRIFLWFIYVYSVLLLLPAYYFFVFPNIPQELGGVKPKICTFEVDKESFTFGNEVSFIKDTIPNSKLAVSDTVLVYYYNNDKFIIKTNKWADIVFEIPRGDIKTIRWLDDAYMPETRKRLGL